jgi:hypothetical protein
LTNNNANNNNEKDLYAYSSASCTVEQLAFSNNSVQLSFVTDSSPTSISGSETNANVLYGKTNVNGYASIGRSGDLNVTFFYDDSGMSSSDESSVALYRLDGSTWAEVPNTSVNTSGNHLSATLSEFGTFGLFKDSGSSSSSSSNSGGSSAYSRSIAKGTITDLTPDAAGRITKDSTALSSNGNAKLEFIKGAIALDANGDPVRKVIITIPASLPSDTPKEVLDSGLYYDFGPSGATFSENVLISIDFDPEDFKDTIPMIYTYTSEGGWIALKTTVDWDNGKVMAYTDHFSLYAVFDTDVEDTGISMLETAEIPTETSAVEYDDTSIEDNGASSFVYWALGIVIVLSLGFVVLKKHKGKGGL